MYRVALNYIPFFKGYFVAKWAINGQSKKTLHPLLDYLGNICVFEAFYELNSWKFTNPPRIALF